ncbi:squalene--hopene cyclase [Bacillus lacus]|uniref:Squalene--hopene cyclase n=1 Tax=Metabacillus lacus TaxID=1983721 RepID=A0A7X2M142_9BACI|nr:prenyltransferase/squalene oxidase repeat-containing protein [Metabacillus lacus]MRX74182.1 squalene--hopene cyclase [Metabacillus lacus]
MFKKSLALMEIEKLISSLREQQNRNGSWHFCFEGGPMTDSFVIMLFQSLQLQEDSLIRSLAERLLAAQQPNGAWKLYEDEPEGNLTATVQAYNALLFAGSLRKTDEKMKKAEQFIIKKGGLKNIHFMTKWMLAANGQIPWPAGFYIPMHLLLLPRSSPLHFYSLSSYARIHFIPMMVGLNKRVKIRSPHTPDLSHLYRTSREELWKAEEHEERGILKAIQEETMKAKQLPFYLKQKGYHYAEKYMLNRIERDGLLLSYGSATIFMIYALLGLGYKRSSPLIQRALRGLKSLAFPLKHTFHIENSTSIVWDTGLLSYALQRAGISKNHPMVKSAVQYLLSKQHNRLGDWSVNNPGTHPGGWGFSETNSIHPDNDDTAAALRSLSGWAKSSDAAGAAWTRGTNWLLSMQNKDGGWGAFEKDVNSPLLTLLPLENAGDAATDPSTADLTGRVLEFLGHYAKVKVGHPSADRGITWLKQHQEKDGSWYGRWGVCYIYGTWAALTGLHACGTPQSDKAVNKGITWLKSIQLEDGGWGESCNSAEMKTFIPLTESTIVQTAWALNALLCYVPKSDNSIQKGMGRLSQLLTSGPYETYPTGIGLPGQFFINYHSYPAIFSLLAFSAYCADE